MNDLKINRKTTLILSLTLMLFVLVLPIQWQALAQNVIRPLETEISFPREISNPDVNFNLQPMGIRKFKVVLDKKQQQLTNIKVYDILGNLILQDKIKPEDGIQKNYDLSHTKSRLFVVEIGNSKYNKTKSIYAHPQGSKNSNASIQE